jgi:hypothetical protein
MTGIHGKRWLFFVWDEDNEEHLARRYVITPNKKTHGPKRYRIDGKTNAGRKLRIIFEDLGSSMARIITGWDL